VLIELGPNFPAGRIRLGHESLDVTLAYLKDAESEEAQEHANSSCLALYASSLAQLKARKSRPLGRRGLDHCRYL